MVAAYELRPFLVADSDIPEEPLNEEQQRFADEYDRVTRLLQSDPAPWLDDREAEFCSGEGQFHSDELDAKRRRPYLGITLQEIRDMADSPPSVEKADGRWLIPSTLKSRSHRRQRDEGAFGLLWADVDHPAKPMDHYIATVGVISAGCNFEMYASRSATEARQKFRILIPLKIRLTAEQWERCQLLLALALRERGIEPDMAALRPGQLCYLPNRGAFYAAMHKRDGDDLNPATDWVEALYALKRAEDRVARKMEAEKEAHRLALEARRARFAAGEGEDIIQAFKARYGIEEQLAAAGYEQSGSDWRHPGSESGSYSLNVKDGLAFALSPNDPLWTGGAGGKAHDSFSVFVTLNHGGNVKSAIKSLKEKA